MTVEDAKLKYNNLKEALGHSPSSSEFFKSSGISKRALGKLLNNEAWSKLVQLCGDTPNKFSSPKSKFDDILIKYGELTRQKRRAPLIVDWENEGL